MAGRCCGNGDEDNLVGSLSMALANPSSPEPVRAASAPKARDTDVLGSGHEKSWWIAILSRGEQDYPCLEIARFSMQGTKVDGSRVGGLGNDWQY